VTCKKDETVSEMKEWPHRARRFAAVVDNQSHGLSEPCILSRDNSYPVAGKIQPAIELGRSA
jgi:hypothetical protein